MAVDPAWPSTIPLSYNDRENPMPQPQPTSFLSLPDVEESDLARMVKRELVLALVPFLLLTLTSYAAIYRLPSGKAFILEPYGRGLFYDILVAVLAVGLFGAFYMFPALWVGRRI